jgi:tRNA 2-thiocytidine biosynthesis protein TtcA
MQARTPDLPPDEARRRALNKRLGRRMGASCQKFQLLRPGDRVMVAVSGGKDSYTLLHLMTKLVKRVPFDVSLVAVHLDQKQPGYDGATLEAWLEAQEVDYEILAEDTYSVVTEKLDEGATYCSLCSRLRRGILYTAAERLGCTAIALGHHRDDSLETFLMNLMYEGRLQAMPAGYTTNDGRFRVIRPLIECAEAEIAELAELEGFPILPCNLCGSQDGLKRDAMTRLLTQLEQSNPEVRNIMLAALGNVRPTHLLDRDVAEAWAARAEDLRPEAPARPAEKHAAAEPKRARHRLPVVES